MENAKKHYNKSIIYLKFLLITLIDKFVQYIVNNIQLEATLA